MTQEITTAGRLGDDAAGLLETLRLAAGDEGLTMSPARFDGGFVYSAVHRGEEDVGEISIDPYPRFATIDVLGPTDPDAGCRRHRSTYDVGYRDVGSAGIVVRRILEDLSSDLVPGPTSVPSP